MKLGQGHQNLICFSFYSSRTVPELRDKQELLFHLWCMDSQNKHSKVHEDTLYKLRCEKASYQIWRGNHEADQRLYFLYIDSTIPLLPKSEISSL